MLGLCVVALVVLLQAMTQIVAGHERPRILSHLAFLAMEMPPLMAVLSLGYGWVTRRRLGSIGTVLVGMAVAAALGAVAGYAYYLLQLHVPSMRVRPGTPNVSRVIFFGITYGQLHFGLWTLAFVFPSAVEDARVRSLEAEKLRLEAEKLRSLAELAHLRANLEPHFLLNTLNAIAGLVTDDPREARRLLVCLGDLLRDALRDEDEMQTLDEQMAWLRRYAEILEARHPGDLVFRWEIAGEARDVLMPRLLLQPLIENAVKHGALRRRGGGEVIVRASLVNGSKVLCTVEDNGPGMPDSTRSGAFGLHAVRRRLELKYADEASFRLESTPEGTRSIVELPRAGA